MAKLKINKGAVPTLDDASDNLGGSPNLPVAESVERIHPMSFKMPDRFYKDVKQFALDNGVSVTEVFKRSFYFYRENKK